MSDQKKTTQNSSWQLIKVMSFHYFTEFSDTFTEFSDSKAHINKQITKNVQKEYVV